MTSYKLHTDRTQRNVFEKYFSEILREDKVELVETGPYVSISRDFGCMANPIALRLSRELTRLSKESGKGKEWKWFNKVILEESAKALDLSPSKIKYIFRSHKKSMIDEIVGAMATKYYKSDKKIRRTIIDVIRLIVKTGYVIIVGRGGVAFANDNPQSLHIKITAPFEWRVEMIRKNYNKTEEDAHKYLLEVDNERKYLIDSFMGFGTDHSIFDVVFNRKTITEDEILNTIISLLKMKNLII